VADHLVLEGLVELRDRRREPLGEIVRLDVAGAVGERRELAPGEVLGRADRPDAVAGTARLLVRVGRPGRNLYADLLLQPEHLALLAERDLAATREVEERRRQRAARRPAREDERAGGRREVARRTGHVDRGVVEVDGVAAVAHPR